MKISYDTGNICVVSRYSPLHRFPTTPTHTRNVLKTVRRDIQGCVFVKNAFMELVSLLKAKIWCRRGALQTMATYSLTDINILLKPPNSYNQQTALRWKNLLYRIAYFLGKMNATFFAQKTKPSIFFKMMSSYEAGGNYFLLYERVLLWTHNELHHGIL